MSISIIITNYNYGHYLSECLESVISQSCSDFEVIVVDDASTDNSWEILQEYAKQDERIHVHKNGSNQGYNNSIRKGIDLAKATYCHCLSADDKYLPGFLEKTLNLLKNHPEIGLCCSDFGYFHNNDSERILSTKVIEKFKYPSVFPSSSVISIFRKFNFWIPGSSCIFKRELMHRYGPFDSRLYTLQDWFLFHKIALFEGAGYIPETLTAMRIHANTFTASCSKSKETQRNMRRHLFEILEDPLNKVVCEKYKKSAILGPHFKNFDALKKPKLWGFYPPLIHKSLSNRWKKLQNKK